MSKFYSKDFQQVADELRANLSEGLSNTEAQLRLQKYGYNKIKNLHVQVSAMAIFLRQFYNPMMLLLLVAVLISLFLQEYSDAVVISVAVLFNVAMGFFQEFRAEKVAYDIAEKAEDEALVLRGGGWRKVRGCELVPGDIVSLKAGDAILADLRLFEVNFLKTKEAALTGEAVDVTKQLMALDERTMLGDRSNMVFSGTYVVSGSGLGIVVATGKSTQAGQIHELLMNIPHEKTPLQRQIEIIAWLVTGIIFVIMGLILLGGLIRGISFAKILSMSVAVAVAEVPEGLMIAMTVILAIGMQRMMQNKALVRNLLTTEILGSVSVVCTDKTGTLTEGKMTLKSIVTTQKIFDPEHQHSLDQEALRILCLAKMTSEAKKIAAEKFEGDEAEVAILRSSLRVDGALESLEANFERLDFLPFDPENRYAASLCRDHAAKILTVKGSHETILREMCVQSTLTERFLKMAEELTLDGVRVFALAGKKSEANKIQTENFVGLEPLGLLCFSDPLRQTAQATIAEMQRAGVRVVMITGDHKQTALNIALEAGIPASKETVLEGCDLEVLSDAQMVKAVENTNVFARVSPQDKIRIVQAFKAAGNVTAMTGDGANDAPALKAASVGLALGSGSQVAKSVAGIVLLDSNLETISLAIKEGRIIFENIGKSFLYFLVDAFSETILVIGALLLNLPAPLFPAQILWINLIADSLSSFSFTSDAGSADIMTRKPRKKDAPLCTLRIKNIFFFCGMLVNFFFFLVYYSLLKFGVAPEVVRSIIFQSLVFNILICMFPVKALANSIWEVNLFSNHWMLGSFVLGLALQFLAVNLSSLASLLKLAKIPAQFWLLVLGLALVKTTVIEIAKLLFLDKKIEGSVI